MKLSINILKEPATFVAKCKEKEAQLEINGLFNNEENLNSLDNAEIITENFPYIKKGIKNTIKRWFYLNCVKIYSHLINKKLTKRKLN